MQKMRSDSLPLVSVIVLTYRNYDYIFETLSSVFKQTYPNIELIISDDGSDNFPGAEVEKHITREKTDNIKKIYINCEKNNLGTVRHLNKAIKLTTGDFIIALAGDDTFFDNNVIKKYIENFSTASDNYLIHMAQTAMYDITLKHLQGYYCKPDIANALYANDFDTLLNRLCLFPCLPSTSTCFKRGFFDTYGMFDESYKLIEDWPMHLRLIENKCKILYDNFIAIKHRHGGISHGANNVLSHTQCAYYRDLFNIHQKEILPKLHLLDESTQNRVKDRLRSEDLWIENTLYKEQRELKKFMVFLLRHPAYIIKNYLIGNWFKITKNSSAFFVSGIVFLVLLPFIRPILLPFMETATLDYAISLGQIFSLVVIAIGGCGVLLGGIGKILVKLETFPMDCLYIG